jgi:hypothetical protein
VHSQAAKTYDYQAVHVPGYCKTISQVVEYHEQVETYNEAIISSNSAPTCKMYSLNEVESEGSVEVLDSIGIKWVWEGAERRLKGWRRAA